MSARSARSAAIPAPASWRLSRQLGTLAVYGALIAASLLFVAPFFWVVSTSLKDLPDAFVYPPKWIPDPPRWSNYVQAISRHRFDIYFRNSSIITGLDIVGRIVSCSLIAFSFARLRWAGRDAMFVLTLSLMMLPTQVTMIPQFIVFKELGWIDSILPLVVPNFFGHPFYVFLLRQFFMGIPRELDDAARIDGANSLGILWSIVLPLSKPALATVAIFTFQFSWNEFLLPLIYIHSKAKQTVALGLLSFQDEFGTQWTLLMAAALVTMLPVLIVFLVAQKYFIQGIAFTGLKG
jgi:ABC-type glycerol-3-phosphate transport system permease component